MQSKIKKSTILTIILITLLLHLLFLYFFTTVPFSSAPDRISEFIQNLLGKDPEIQEKHQQLQSHAPQQSAPVIFRDEPEEKEPVKQQAPPEPEQKKLVSHAANPLAKPVEEKKEEPERVKKEEIKKQENESVPRAPSDYAHPGLQARRATPDKHDERREEKTISEPKKPKTKKQKLESTMLTDWHHNREEEKKEITKSVPRAPQDEREEKDKKREEVKKPKDSERSSSVRPERAKDPVGTRERTHKASLADLSQQFMQKVATIETGASGAMRVQGNSPYGHPSAYQIALERYVSKMCLEIETAYRIETNQSVQATQHKPFLLMVEVNSDGRINTIYPSQSSGIARIDEFAMSVFKSASKSFPKLPEAIGINFRIQFGINHIDHLGQLRHGTLSNG